MIVSNKTDAINGYNRLKSAILIQKILTIIFSASSLTLLIQLHRSNNQICEENLITRSAELISANPITIDRIQISHQKKSSVEKQSSARLDYEFPLELLIPLLVSDPAGNAYRIVAIQDTNLRDEILEHYFSAWIKSDRKAALSFLNNEPKGESGWDRARETIGIN
jgi:hypothetical protein